MRSAYSRFCYLYLNVCVLRPASLTHENPQIRKIIHSMHLVGPKHRSINQSEHVFL